MLKLNLTNVIKEGDNFYVKGSGHRFKIPKLDKTLALFVGLIYGDGWLVSRKTAINKGNWVVGLAEGDKIVVEEFRYLAKILFNLTFRKYKCSSKQCYETKISSRLLYEFLYQNFELKGGLKSKIIKLPKLIKKNNLINHFISGLFSTDGCITKYKNYPYIKYNSISKTIVKEVQKFLKKEGFNPKFSIMKFRKNPLYGIRLNGYPQLYLFQNKIGFIGKKQKILKEMLTTKDMHSPVVQIS